MQLPAWIANNILIIAAVLVVFLVFPQFISIALAAAIGLWVGWNALKQPKWASDLWDNIFGE